SLGFIGIVCTNEQKSIEYHNFRRRFRRYILFGQCALTFRAGSEYDDDSDETTSTVSTPPGSPSRTRKWYFSFE
ncbi:13135_t:CDS:2, partial [Ambispora leptoticha]